MRVNSPPGETYQCTVNNGPSTQILYMSNNISLICSSVESLAKMSPLFLAQPCPTVFGAIWPENVRGPKGYTDLSKKTPSQSVSNSSDGCKVVI